VIVDVASSAAVRCASCGGALTAPEPPSESVWEDDPTERRPIGWLKTFESRR
jgi:hypothetical protein